MASEMPNVMCCVCGAVMEANPSNMCTLCLQKHVSIMDGIGTDNNILFCKYCERYLQPPKYWVSAALESKELLTLCLKRIKGLNQLKLVDACFIWTEPHSRRLKIKITAQKEVFTGTFVQQSTVVEFVVLTQMCETCQKVKTGQEVWNAVVQVRQKTDHKRTFFYLEQLMLKNKMHQSVTKLKELPDGLDFFYMNRSNAISLVDFLDSVAPIRWKQAEELISHDTKSNTAEFHYTYSVELAPICKEDLICLPPKYSASMGSLGPITLCLKVNSAIVVMDIATLRVGQIPGHLYWKSPFESVANIKQAIEFYVMDIEVDDSHPQNGKYQLAYAQVCKATEIGKGKVYCCKTHLGGELEVGDSVIGYMTCQMNHNNDSLQQHKELQLPDVVLVHKHYPSRKKNRHWKLKEMRRELVVNKKHEMEKREQDKQLFMDELERDPEYRQKIKLYRNKKLPTDLASEVEDDEGPKVGIEELVDEDDDMSEANA